MFKQWSHDNIAGVNVALSFSLRRRFLLIFLVSLSELFEFALQISNKRAFHELSSKPKWISGLGQGSDLWNVVQLTLTALLKMDL